MNNNRYTYYLLLLLPALLLFSCTQEDMPGVKDDSGIVFRVFMPGAEARSAATTETGSLTANGFYVTAFCPEDDVNGPLNPYLDEQYAMPLEDMSGYFGIFDPLSSKQCVWPTSRRKKRGQLKFFAFYPSLETMRQSAGVGTEFFNLVNNSTKQGGSITYDYRMNKFVVNNDISRHIDFVTATAEGTKLDNGETGVALAFEHQLSRIALTAWGDTKNDIEIAGVRIGGVVTQCDFNFDASPTNYKPGDNTTHGNWVDNQVKGCVEYIFREGDAVVKIGNGNHTSLTSAASIMGNSECAMVIPADNPGWDHSNDATNKKKGLYFSILLRIKEANESRTLVYPYVAGGNISSSLSTDAMEVVFLAVNKETQTVTKRLYRNKDDKKYYTDPDFNEAYDMPATEEIRNYAWAAVPLSPKTTYRWKPGYQYTYALNYSVGVGVHDPSDPLPGKAILSKVMVKVDETKNAPWPRVNNFESGSETDVTDNVKIE